MPATAMSAAFERAGVRAELVEFDKAIARLLNRGGTIDDARARVELAAQKLPGEASQAVPNGQPRNAYSRQPNGDEAGLCMTAREGQATIASPSPPNRKLAPIGVLSPTISPLPTREPSTAHRAAMRLVRKEATAVILSIFDTWRLRDGRPIGNIKFYELAELRAANLVEAELIRLIQLYCEPSKASDRIRDALKPDVLEDFIKQAERAGDDV